MQKDKKTINFKFLGQDLIQFKKSEVTLIRIMFIDQLDWLLKKVSKKDEIELFFKYRIIKKK